MIQTLHSELSNWLNAVLNLEMSLHALFSWQVSVPQSIRAIGIVVMNANGRRFHSKSYLLP